MARDSLSIDLQWGNGITVNGRLGFYLRETYEDCFILCHMNMMEDEHLLAPKPLVEWSN